MTAVEASRAVDADAAYYQAVEEFFVSRRGDPLFLSSADWMLVHKWRTQALPLRVVLRGIGDALDGHAHSWGRHRRVGSLRYCAAEVEAARDRWERALALGAEPGNDWAEVLRGFAAALDAAAGLGPAAQRVARPLAAALREQSLAPPERARDLEPWLAAREAELLAVLGADLGAEALARVEAEVEAKLAVYQGRMPERVLAQVRADGIARRLLAGHGLPRLSIVLS